MSPRADQENDGSGGGGATTPGSSTVFTPGTNTAHLLLQLRRDWAQKSCQQQQRNSNNNFFGAVGSGSGIISGSVRGNGENQQSAPAAGPRQKISNSARKVRSGGNGGSSGGGGGSGGGHSRVCDERAAASSLVGAGGESSPRSSGRGDAPASMWPSLGGKGNAKNRSSNNRNKRGRGGVEKAATAAAATAAAAGAVAAAAAVAAPATSAPGEHVSASAVREKFGAKDRALAVAGGPVNGPVGGVGRGLDVVAAAAAVVVAASRAVVPVASAKTMVAAAAMGDGIVHGAGIASPVRITYHGDQEVFLGEYFIITVIEGIFSTVLVALFLCAFFWLRFFLLACFSVLVFLPFDVFAGASI